MPIRKDFRRFADGLIPLVLDSVRKDRKYCSSFNNSGASSLGSRSFNTACCICSRRFSVRRWNHRRCRPVAGAAPSVRHGEKTRQEQLAGKPLQKIVLFELNGRVFWRSKVRGGSPCRTFRKAHRLFRNVILLKGYASSWRVEAGNRDLLRFKDLGLRIETWVGHGSFPLGFISVK